jgi:hypothetical protein
MRRSIFHSTHHPIITSLEAGETWSWCYVDNVMMELLKALLSNARAKRHSSAEPISLWLYPFCRK